MVFELLAPGVIYNALKDGLKYVRGRGGPKFTNAERIALAAKWKPLFRENILDNFSKDLRSDVIIRDVRRVDQYPDAKEQKKGISPWFRLGLMDTYHNGILVGLHWQRLIQIGDGEFRVAKVEESRSEDDNGIKVILAGRIPFHLIESVDWEGDEYYPFPHIYCHFSIKGQPYEDVEFYEKRSLGERHLPYFAQIGKYKQIAKASKAEGIKYI